MCVGNGVEVGPGRGGSAGRGAGGPAQSAIWLWSSAGVRETDPPTRRSQWEMLQLLRWENSLQFLKKLNTHLTINPATPPEVFTQVKLMLLREYLEQNYS